MNPIIAEMAKVVPFSPIKHVWFDLSDEESLKSKMSGWLKGRSFSQVIPNDVAKDIPMPFDSIALIVPIGLRRYSGDIEPRKMVITFERNVDLLRMCFWLDKYAAPVVDVSITERLIDKPKHMEVNPNFVKNAKLAGSDATEKVMMLLQYNLPIFGAICYSPTEHAFALEGYKCTPNPSNANRIKRGKRPLFEWETVLIKPVVRESKQSLGGSHASPKPHDRRGHERRYKNGKIVYIKPCTINKHKIKEEGFIHHDYKLK